MYVLSLNNLNWFKIKLYNGTLDARSGHTAASYGSKLIIFGGVNTNGFVSADADFIELDPVFSK